MGFFKKSIHTIFFNGLNMVIALACSAIIARKLGPYNKGIFSAVFLIPTFIVMLGNMGIDFSNIYYIAKKQKEANTYFINSIVMGLLLSIFFIPLSLLIFYIFKEEWFENIPLKFLLLSLLLIPFGLLKRYFIGIIRGFNKIEYSNFVNFGMNIFYLLLVLILGFIYVLNVKNMIIVMIIITFFATILSILFLNKLFAMKLTFAKNNFIEFKKSFFYGFKGYLSNVFTFLNYRAGMFLIIKFLNPFSLGIYSISILIAEKLWIIPNNLAYVLFPHVATYNEKKVTPFLTRIIFFLMIIICIILALLMKNLIVLIYSKMYITALIPFLYLLPGIIFLSVGKLIISDLNGRGYTKYPLYSTFMSLIINIILNIILIPKLGIKGASIATSTSHIFNTIYIIFIFSKLSKIKIKDLLILKKEDIRLLLKYAKNYKKEK